MQFEFDYIIIGAGPAGAILAERLSADAHHRVALIEAGGRNDDDRLRMPAGVAANLRRSGPHVWDWRTTPQAGLEGRKLRLPMGRGFGGGAAIGAMMLAPPDAAEFKAWAIPNWDAADMAPFLARAAARAPGVLQRSGNPLFAAFIEAGVEAGYPNAGDFTDSAWFGFGWHALSLKNGARSSIADTVLTPIVGVRPNLKVFTGLRCTRIMLENARAVGVALAKHRGGQEIRLACAGEIVLCAGAIGTPHLLMLSGLGPAESLRANGVSVVHDAPQIGANLHDALSAAIVFNCPKPLTYWSRMGRREAFHALNWRLRQAGPGRLSFLEAGAYVKTRGELRAPDVELACIAGIFIDHGRVRMDRDGFTLQTACVRPIGRGEIKLANDDPFTPPLVDPRYLTADSDVRALRDAVRIARDLAGRSAMAFYKDDEIAPGAEVRTDAELDLWLRRTAETAYRIGGSAALGQVVDAQLRVIGADALRIADSSILPGPIAGPPELLIRAIAERCADMMLAA